MTAGSSLRYGTLPDVFVEHYSAGAGTAKTTADFMLRAGNSANAIVDRAGNVEEPVDGAYAAWHAGDHNRAKNRGSRFPSAAQLQALVDGTRDMIPIGEVPYERGIMNRRSYGIEHVNLGWAYGDKPDAVKLRHRNPASRDDDWQPYTDAQIEASIEVHQRAIAKWPSLRFVTGHEDVCHADAMGDNWRTKELERVTGAKLDPGPAFPWSLLLARLPLVRVAYDFKAHGWRIER